MDERGEDAAAAGRDEPARAQRDVEVRPVVAAGHDERSGAIDAGVAQHLGVGGVPDQDRDAALRAAAGLGDGLVSLDRHDAPTLVVEGVRQPDARRAEAGNDDVVAVEQAYRQHLHLLVEEPQERQRRRVAGEHRADDPGHQQLPGQARLDDSFEAEEAQRSEQGVPEPVAALPELQPVKADRAEHEHGEHERPEDERPHATPPGQAGPAPEGPAAPLATTARKRARGSLHGASLARADPSVDRRSQPAAPIRMLAVTMRRSSARRGACTRCPRARG